MKFFCAVFFTVAFPLFSMAQTDLCWRDSYPQIPGQWAGFGSVVEAGNRFQTIPGVTVELWSLSSDYAATRRGAANHEPSAGTLVRTVIADQQGLFKLGEFLPGFYEMRARMGGRETAIAFINKQNYPAPQWMGRGLRIALSFKDKGCSRIYAAGLDDTDCGILDCSRLPFGRMRIIHADGKPLGQSRLFFRPHSKSLEAVEFTLVTDADGFATITSAHGCYDISIDGPRPGSMHLCFREAASPSSVTVVLPPQQNP